MGLEGTRCGLVASGDGGGKDEADASLDVKHPVSPIPIIVSPIQSL